MSKHLQSALGVILAGVGVWAFLFVPGRGDVASLGLVGFGCWLISKSAVVDFARSAIELVKAWRK